MINRFWQDFERSRGPQYPELKQLLQRGGDFLPDERVAASERFLQMQFLYGYLFFGYISAGTGLNILNHRINAKGWKALAPEKRSFYQKFSYNGTDHFYIGSFIHIERLTEEEKRILTLCLMDKESAMLVRRAGMMVRNTYKKVLSSVPDNNRDIVDIMTKESGAVKVSGKTILLGICSAPVYDSEGQYANNEVQRRRVLRHVKEELQEKISKFTGTDVYMLLDI